MPETLVMPRPLAIRILHAAQVAQPASIRGVVGARGAEPVSFHAGREVPPPGETLWARLWSHPEAEAVPSASELTPDGLSLVVSLNIKGVLEMRAWRLQGGDAQEQVLKIKD
ncbi:MAG TPA: hypothetical protein VFV11_06760 [Solimonas sp.]|nr:hypothetical protein [Solimonas sp.]